MEQVFGGCGPSNETTANQIIDGRGMKSYLILAGLDHQSSLKPCLPLPSPTTVQWVM
jgi:hypothetical protein